MPKSGGEFESGGGGFEPLAVGFTYEGGGGEGLRGLGGLPLGEVHHVDGVFA